MKNSENKSENKTVIKVGKNVTVQIKRFIIPDGEINKTVFIPSNIRIERKDDYTIYLQYILATADKKHFENTVKFYQSKKDKLSNALTTATADNDTVTVKILNAELGDLNELEKTATNTLKQCEEFISTIEKDAKAVKTTLSDYDLQFFTDLMIATKNKRLNYNSIEQPLNELIQKLASNKTIPEDFENTDYKEVKTIIKKATQILNGHAITGDFFAAFTPRITAEDMRSILRFQYNDIIAYRDFTTDYINDTKKQLATRIYAIAFKDILTDRDTIKPNKQN